LVETALNGLNEYAICPECDEALLVGPLVSQKESHDASDRIGLSSERIPAEVTEACRT
jgi:hypothetical protein